jgi:LysR family glycine cleavage system transcriptional activator
VTPSAVSRQISALEAFLNVRLFNRGRDGNTLTPAGEEYCREIAPAFEAISAATDRIRRRQDKTPLNVRVPFDLRHAFPDPAPLSVSGEEPGISVRIVTGFGAVDFAREDVDVSIQAVSGDWPGAQFQPRFENWVQPVCGPQLLTTCMIREVDDLRTVRLLQS